MLTYTKEDYLTTEAPYEALYEHIGDKFTLNRLLLIYSDHAKSLGVNNFRTIFKAYCDTKRMKTNNEIVGNVTAFEGQPLELDSGQWECDDFGVVTTLGEGAQVQACCHPILPVERLVNIDTNTEKLKIAYKKGHVWRSLIADKETLASGSKILSLANQGVAVNSENCRWLIRYLHDTENLNYDRLPEKKSIGRCGWVEDYGFAPYVEDLVFDGELSFKHIFESIHSKGSKKKWLEVAKEARQTMQSRIILDAAFASVLVEPLGCLPFFVHIWSSVSGTGKTLSLMLAASVWADPAKGRYWSTFNSTGVGQELTAGFLNHLPLILDELQLVRDKKNFDKTVYELSEGVGRTRGAKNGGVQQTTKWANTIITSGESPLTSFSSGAGALNRIVEISCTEKLFENGMEVAATLRQNYGFAGKEFVEWLEKGNMELVRRSFDLYYNDFANGEVAEKQVMAAGLLLATDMAVTMLFFPDEQPLEAKELAQYLKTKSEADINRRAYDYLLQTCQMNPSRFKDDEDNKGELWGVSDDNFFYIFRLKFQQLCQQEGFHDVALLAWLKENKLISFSKGCLKTKRINGVAVSCIWLKRTPAEGFYLTEEDEDAPF